MDAARTASAPPAVSPSYRWSSPPTPPEAITGIPTRSAMARVSRMSYPSRVPSRSMLVSRISPAPYRSIPAAHRKRHEHLLGGAANHIHEDVALLVGCGDVEKGEFVGLLVVVPAGDLHGVARVPQGDEPDALHHAAVLHIQARYDPLGKHFRRITAFPSSWRPQAKSSRRRSHDRSIPRTPRRLPYP